MEREEGGKDRTEKTGRKEGKSNQEEKGYREERFRKQAASHYSKSTQNAGWNAYTDAGGEDTAPAISEDAPSTLIKVTAAAMELRTPRCKEKLLAAEQQVAVQHVEIAVYRGEK